MVFVSTCAALVLALAQTTFADGSSSNTCQSFGVDYQQNGTYFQNSNINNTFTAYQQFSGCNSDTAHNVIIDPNGDQSECSSTSMQPSDTDMLVTCGNWTSSNMYSGDWSILVVSNNGNGTPIAYQRDFSISVGQPVATVSAAPTFTSTISETTTTTSTSTAMVTSTELSGSNSSTSSSSSSDSVASASSTSTSYNASTSIGGTDAGSDGVTTVTSFSTVTSTLMQNGTSCSAIASTPASASATATMTQTWRYPPDPMARIVPSVLGKQLDDMAASIIGTVENAFQTPAGVPSSAKFRRAIIEGRAVNADLKRAFVKERAALLRGANAIAKRHPDSETSTIYTGSTTSTVYTTETATSTAYTTTTSTSSPNVVGRDASSTTTVTIPTTITETACPTS